MLTCLAHPNFRLTRNRFAHLVLLSLTLALGLGGGSSLVQAEEITIAVAANFSATAKELVQSFEANSQHRIRLASGSTGSHYAQILNGAPFDIFFAADIKTPQKLDQDHKIIPGSRFTYARGRLVLWSKNTELIDGEGKVLTSDEFQRLAIASPKLAPYGLAAEETLKALGLWEKLARKIVRGENISQTYQFVYTGAAELGFVALAQVIDRKQAGTLVGSYWLVPQNLYTPIDQQAVLLTNKVAAQEFLQYVKSDVGQKIIATYGYDAVSD